MSLATRKPTPTLLNQVRDGKGMSDLMELTKKELLALCEEAGIEADSKMTKAVLVGLLEAPAEAPTDSEPVEAPVEPVVEEEVVEPAPAPKKAKKAAPAASMPDPEDESLSSAEFVKAAYLAILKREADEGGLKHYTRALDMHRTLTREQVLERLLASDEGKAKN